MFDLKECLRCSNDAFQKRFGRIPDFKLIEAKLIGLKGSDRGLDYRKIKELKKRKYWDFSNFWMMPSWLTCLRKLKTTSGIFKVLPDQENQTAIILYDIFKNIEVVSIIFRFVDPKNYGIISPPVRCALGLKAKDNYVDEYLDYLSVLRTYADDYGFRTVAEADIALWTLVEKCLKAESPECENFRAYQDKMIAIEEEYIKKSQIFKKMEEEIWEVAGDEVENAHAELDKTKVEISELLKERETFPLNLVRLEKSARKAHEKIIHDRREPDVDTAQRYFIQKLAENVLVNQVIWSENISAKHPNRISAIRDDGELTILYVSKDNYAAKLKVRPLRCPDRTHARFFANIVAKSMNIPVMEDKDI